MLARVRLLGLELLELRRLPQSRCRQGRAGIDGLGRQASELDDLQVRASGTGS